MRKNWKKKTAVVCTAAVMAAAIMTSEFATAHADDAAAEEAAVSAAAGEETPAAVSEGTEEQPAEDTDPAPTEEPTETPAEDPGTDPAEDPDPQPEEEAPYGYALDPATGENVAISEAAQAQIDAGAVYQDETGYLVQQDADGKVYLVNPTTGERTDQLLPEKEDGTDDSKKDESTDKEEKKADSKEDSKESDKPETVTYEASKKELENIDESKKTSNAKLIANQTIVKLPETIKDFRFWTVTRNYAFAKDKMSIREEKSDSADSVGKLKKNAMMFVLKDEEDGWLYVESGDARGFVKASAVVTGTDAESIYQHYKDQAMRQASIDGTDYEGIETVAPVATDAASMADNDAYLYLRATVEDTLADKVYAIAATDGVSIREEKTDDARTIGTMSKGNLCYVLKDAGKGWFYVESGDVRGFVRSSEINQGDTVTAAVESNGEDKYTLASQEVEPEDNAACYYTKTSTTVGVPDGTIRNSMVEYAASFIGNPYVWGGTSLTDGADCSGFVQQIYAAYGYDIPRTSGEQSQYGTKIAVEDAEPGDLIFYAKDGVVYHVVMYAGDGLTVEAMSEDYGIVQSQVNTGSAVWACRILDDSESELTLTGGIDEVNATEDMYGEDLGSFTLTYYCNCEICCGQWAGGNTATGTPVVEGRTIAVDPSVIPYGTQVIINGHVFTAEDCGSGIDGNRIDVYVNDHDYANQLGETQAEVYLVK